MDVSGLNESDLTKLWELSDEDRVRRAKKFYYPEDQKRCLSAGLLIRRFLQEHSINAGEGISYNPYGKPYLIPATGDYFNISHSGKWVVIATGQTEVGVDVEEIRPFDEGVLTECFSPEEIEYVREKKEEEALRFTKLWTLKESYVKYAGTGISNHLKELCVQVNGSEITMKGKPEICFSTFLWDEQYCLSVCGPEQAVQPREILGKDIWNQPSQAKKEGKV